MQSYFDLQILLLVGGAVLLLILILFSFLINNKKISYLEISLDNKDKALKQFIEETNQSLNKILSEHQALDRSLKAQEQSVKFLTDNQQEFIDGYKEIKNRLDSCESNIRALAHKISESKKVQANSQKESLNKAVSMLESGLKVQEVADKTSLAETEVQMLNALRSSNLEKLKNEDNLVKEKEVSPAPLKARSPVANFKARDAYGIKDRSLKRLR